MSARTQTQTGSTATTITTCLGNRRLGRQDRESRGGAAMFHTLVNIRVALRSAGDKIVLCEGKECHVPFIMMAHSSDLCGSYCPACRMALDEAFETGGNDLDAPSNC